MDDDFLKELIDELIVESTEGLDQLEQDLLKLESEELDDDTINGMFRVLHTIKGSSGSIGFEKIQSVAHKGESLLDKVRDHEMDLTSKVTDLLLKTMDALREMFNCLESDGNEGEEEYKELQESLVEAYENAGANQKSETKPKKEAEVKSPKPEVATAAAAAKSSSKKKSVIKAAPVQEKTAPAKAEPVKTETVKKDLPVPVKVKRREPPKPKAKVHVDASIRVDVTQLDDLMNLVGELVLSRNQIIQQTDSTGNASLTHAAQRLNSITTELQQGMMKTRMQPVGNAWTKFPRVVRDIAQQQRKKINFVMEGQETELDRTLIEAIKDPLMHIVRNSADHGIEEPAMRAAAGKPEEGILKIRAFHESGQVNIEIIDDGAGVNVEKVKAKAISSGIITETQAEGMSDAEISRLIFHAGLSTADKVSNVSGRGVGMDVVRTNIDKIGGSVDLHSVRGEGSTLRIKIPLTLAIIPALLIGIGEEQFAIPQISLQELVRLDGDDIKTGIEDLYGTKVYRLRGELLPIVYLRDILGLEKKEADESINSNKVDDGVNIVILHADGVPFGMVVDIVCDSEEIVVKPLSKQLEDIPCFAGATVMGDGRVCLILDTAGIATASHAVRNKHKDEFERDADDGSKSKEETMEILAFALGQDDQMAVPLSMVSRIEDIHTADIENVRDETVVQHRGQILRLLDAADYLPQIEAVNYLEKENVQVIVYTEGEESIGLIVSEIRDILTVAMDLENSGMTEGIKGSMVVKGKVTEFIDLQYILGRANPLLLEGTV